MGAEDLEYTVENGDPPGHEPATELRDDVVRMYIQWEIRSGGIRRVDEMEWIWIIGLHLRRR